MSHQFEDRPVSPQIILQTFGERTVIISAPHAKKGDVLQYMFVYSDGVVGRWIPCEGHYKELVVERKEILEIRSRVVSRPNWLYRLVARIGGLR